MEEYKLLTYNVEYYDRNDELQKNSGIIFATDLPEAMEKLQKFYGDIEEVHLNQYFNESEDTLLELSTDSIYYLVNKGELIK